MGAVCKVGSSYTHVVWNGSEVDFVVVAASTGLTMRFKKEAQGWTLLVLDVRGDCPWKDVVPGHTFYVPKSSAITQRLTRLA